MSGEKSQATIANPPLRKYTAVNTIQPIRLCQWQNNKPITSSQPLKVCIEYTTVGVHDKKMKYYSKNKEPL